MNNSKNISNYFFDQKKNLLNFLVIFILLGLVSLYSATRNLNDLPNSFFYKQINFSILGFLIYFLSKKFTRIYNIFSFNKCWVISILLLLLPWTPLGIEVNGARRWIKILSFSFQPSEFMKIFWMIELSRFVINSHLSVQRKFFATGWLWLKLLSIIGLLMIQPDFGTSFLLTVTTLSILFIAKIRLDFYFSLMILFFISLIGAIVLAPYRMKRFAAFLDPWTFAQDQGYQLIQSLIAIGSGGFLGQGLGFSLQKHLALPEAHTDFIFSIIIEETGFLGGLSLIFLFGWFIFVLMTRGHDLAKRHEYHQSYFFLTSGLLLFFQTFINLGVCMGLLPTKGLTFPFFSYGGSSLWAIMLLMGVLDGLWRADHHES